MVCPLRFRRYQFPEPELYNCGAIGNNGFIFNPNGEIHKCGLAVDDSTEAIGMLGEELDRSRECDEVERLDTAGESCVSRL